MKYYSNEIYPIALVVSNDAGSINEHYSLPDGSDVYEPLACEARVFHLTRRTDKYFAMAIGVIFKTEITYRLVAHESLHVASFMMDRLGVPLSESSEEAWAYLVGWIAECIENFNKDNQ